MSDEEIRCKKGEILRKGYSKKGYLRQGYKKKDGTIIKTKYIKPTNVRAVCIKDVGSKGHGNKTLPKPEKHILTPYGYNIHLSANERRKALKKSAENNGILRVLKHLVLVNNYQQNVSNKQRFQEDIDFMKKMYEPYRKTPVRKVNQTGGTGLSKQVLMSSTCVNDKCKRIVREKYLIGNNTNFHNVTETDGGNAPKCYLILEINNIIKVYAKYRIEDNSLIIFDTGSDINPRNTDKDIFYDAVENFSLDKKLSNICIFIGLSESDQNNNTIRQYFENRGFSETIYRNNIIMEKHL